MFVVDGADLGSEANEGRQDCSKRPYVALGCVALRSVALWCKAVWRVAFAVRRETYVDSYWAAQSPPQAAHENIVLGTQQQGFSLNGLLFSASIMLER